MNKGVQIAIIVLCLAGAGFLVAKQFTGEKPGSAEGARTHYYVCSNSKCKHEFTFTPGENIGDREADTCPDCNTPGASEAARCPACGKLHALEGHGRYKPNCPHCGAAMPPLTEQVRGG